MTVLFATHPLYLEHRHRGASSRTTVTTRRRRRRPAASRSSPKPSPPLEPRPAARTDLERVHPAWYLDRLDAPRRSRRWVDRRRHGDERAVGGRRDAGRRGRPDGRRGAAAGRGRRRRSAPCARRATTPRRPNRWASAWCRTSPWSPPPLADAGERVWIFDFDAHHGNGTQAVFYDDPRVLFVSTHQWPLYPARGGAPRTGSGAGDGTTVNVPLPPGTTGDVYLRAFDEVIAPVVDRFAPTWLLISAGFDAHRDDPLTELGLSAGDFAALTARAHRARAGRAHVGDARGRLRPRRPDGQHGRRARRARRARPGLLPNGSPPAAPAPTPSYADAATQWRRAGASVTVAAPTSACRDAAPAWRGSPTPPAPVDGRRGADRLRQVVAAAPRFAPRGGPPPRRDRPAVRRTSRPPRTRHRRRPATR